MRNYIFVLFALLVCTFKTYSQDSTFYYSGTIIGAASTTQTPFWSTNNQYGAIPSTGSFLSGRASFHRVYNINNPRFFQWSGGAEVIGIAGKRSTAFMTDLFLAGKAGPIELAVGQRKEMIGSADSSLTSGSFALSQNYRPYPKIQLSTPNFTSLVPGIDFLYFKFSYSDGILGPAGVHYGNVSRVDEIYLHHKSIYLRVGRRRGKLNLYAGFNHQAIWGGEDKIFSGGLKRSEAYEYVILGKPWLNSRVGNHFGTIDAAAEWRGSKWNIFLYRQSIYEDGSLSDLSNIVDGLTGLRFKKRSRPDPSSGLSIDTVLLEFIYTKSQGGAVFDFKTNTFGMDDYFNHYVYNQGWSYRGRTLGSPLIAPQTAVREELRTTSSQFTPNNRIIAYHLGANASWKSFNFFLKGTHSANFGTYRNAFKETLRQTSLLLFTEKAISAQSSHHITLSLAADFGKLYPNSAAVMLGWRKSGFIR